MLRAGTLASFCRAFRPKPPVKMTFMRRTSQWRSAAASRLEGIMATMWNADRVCWCDLLLRQERDIAATTFCAAGRHADRIDTLHAASWTPLLWGALREDSIKAAKCVVAMEASELLTPAGLRTSLAKTAHQWDGDNCWPPLVCSWVDGLQSYGGERGRRVARDLGTAFLRAVEHALEDTGVVWEKFSAVASGVAGSGGEYPTQRGFGWSNGAALHMIVHLRVSL